MAEPAMKLTLVIESTQDPAFIPRLIPLLTAMSLRRYWSSRLCPSFFRRCSSATASRWL